MPFLRVFPQPVRVHPCPHNGLDLEYSLFLALTPLASPIAWVHYLPILLLPAAVVGRYLFLEKPGWTGLMTALLLAGALSVPETTAMSIGGSMDHFVGQQLSCLVTSFPTLAVAALWVWTVRIYKGQRSRDRDRLSGLGYV